MCFKSFFQSTLAVKGGIKIDKSFKLRQKNKNKNMKKEYFYFCVIYVAIMVYGQFIFFVVKKKSFYKFPAMLSIIRCIAKYWKLKRCKENRWKNKVLITIIIMINIKIKLNIIDWNGNKIKMKHFHCWSMIKIKIKIKFKHKSMTSICNGNGNLLKIWIIH